MFRRENRKSFGETKNCSGVNHQAEKVSARRPEFFGGCRKCSGTFRIFSGENAREKHHVPSRGTRSPFSWGVVLGGAPLGGQATIGGSLLGGPMVGG